MMPSQFKTLKSQLTTQIGSHLSMPLFRNGYALVSSAALTSGLGMLYWIVAARQYSSEIVGINSALISMMIFLASVSQLDLAYALNRFLPQAGRFTYRFIIYTYAITASLALVVSLVFVMGSRWWSPTLYGYFQDHPRVIVWFVAACMAWCVFALQDSVMTGLRQATWVPLENLIFSVGKLLLLIYFATRFATVGVFGSWIAMVFVLLLPVNWLIFKSLIPKHIEANQDKVKPFAFKEIAGFVASNYFASLFWGSTTDLLPLLVVELISPEANAYFYLPWTIAYSLYLISRNMGMSLITEGARDEKKLLAYSYKVLVQNGRLIFLALIIILPLARPLLQLFGQDYAMQSVGVLRLLCLSAVPNIVTALYSSIVRVQKRMKALLILYASISFIVVSLSVVLMPRVGIIGGGIAWLVGQTVVATVLLATELQFIWLPHLSPKKLKPLLNFIRNSRQGFRNRRNKTVLLNALECIKEPSGALIQVFPTVGDLAVGLVKVDKKRFGVDTAVIKTTTSKLAEISLDNHVQTVTQLIQNKDLATIHGWLPKVLIYQKQDSIILLEEQKTGVPLSNHLGSDHDAQLITRAAKAISLIHAATATEQHISTYLLDRLINNPCQNIAQLPQIKHGMVQSLAIMLTAQLQDCRLTTSLIHGDYSPQNIMLSHNLESVSGILDWERAASVGLPHIDLVHLWLTSQIQIQNLELGQLIINEMETATFTLFLDELENRSALGKRPLLLLTWLWHINANLCKANTFRHNPIWVKNNIDSVLLYLTNRKQGGRSIL